MAPSKTIATLRVPCELRDEIARIAELRGTTMLEVVTDAVHRLGRDEWWSSVRDALDGHGIATVCTGLHTDARFGRGGLTNPDAAVRAKETLAAYRGATCGAKYAEAFRAGNAYVQEIF